MVSCLSSSTFKMYYTQRDNHHKDNINIIFKRNTLCFPSFWVTAQHRKGVHSPVIIFQQLSPMAQITYQYQFWSISFKHSNHSCRRSGPPSCFSSCLCTAEVLQRLLQHCHLCEVTRLAPLYHKIYDQIMLFCLLLNEVLSSTAARTTLVSCVFCVLCSMFITAGLC